MISSENVTIAAKHQEYVRNDLFEAKDLYIDRLLSRSDADIVPEELYWVNTKKRIDITPLESSFKGLANLQRINDLNRINKFFEKVNRSLEYGDYFLINLETMASRKQRILKKFNPLIRWPYYSLDFILKRVFPKWKPTMKIYFWITGGRNRVLSLAEGLGRLSSCGFDIVCYERMGYRTWILARKVSEPAYDMQPTYGPIVKLRRVGKNGKKITVYKLRTMHPYSEYIQDYLFEKNSLQDGGKIRNDFRITSWGRLFRKFWIDEIPMIWNWLKGEMKIVGVRPLSNHYYNLYPDDLKELRANVKPGLIPPFYADMPKELEEIQESERRYLMAYLDRPFATDIRYFFKVVYNILFRGARSR